MLEIYGPYILLGIFLFYLIGLNMYRSKKYARQAQDLIANLKKGDYVKTYSGLFGTVVKVDQITLENGHIEKVLTLEVSENTEIKIDANAVYTKMNDLKAKPKKASTPKAKKEESKEA